jgi:hypothetical protein
MRKIFLGRENSKLLKNPKAKRNPRPPNSAPWTILSKPENGSWTGKLDWEDKRKMKP